MLPAFLYENASHPNWADAKIWDERLKIWNERFKRGVLHADSTRTRKKGIEKRRQGILVREVRPDRQGFLLTEVVKLEPPVIPSLLYSSKAFGQSWTNKDRSAKLLRESQGITAHEGHYFSFYFNRHLTGKEHTKKNEPHRMNLSSHLPKWRIRIMKQPLFFSSVVTRMRGKHYFQWQLPDSTRGGAAEIVLKKSLLTCKARTWWCVLMCRSVSNLTAAFIK